MSTLIHLCKKDFAFAKLWILGTWFALAISNILPWISPNGKEGEPFMMIRLLAPAVMIFLTSTRIIHCDSFVGTSGFMGTRPVRATALLRNKLVLIAFVLVLPAVGFALLHAACLRVNLSALEYLLLLIENWLYFSLIAGAAVAYAVISRNVGIMVIFIIATPSLFLILLAMFNLNWPLGKSLEDQHLSSSFKLVAKALLPIVAVLISMSWVAKRRIWLTAAGFLLCAAFLVAPGLFWTWNFVEEMSRDAAPAEIISDRAEIQWIDTPRFWPNYTSRNNIVYSLVSRPGRVTGLGDHWRGKLVKFRAEAQFKNGTVWKSEGESEFNPFGALTPAVLPQLGIPIAGDQLLRRHPNADAWSLFEFERNLLRGMPDRRASIRGTGTFQLYQPVIRAELPAEVGAAIVDGRFRYRIDSLTFNSREIYLSLSIRGVALESLGDGARESGRIEFLLVNPRTKEFVNTGSPGGSRRLGGEWITVHETLLLDHKTDSPSRHRAEDFLKGARLYILGTRYGGNIALPFEIPEMLLEEKR
jgi:hypothetical protein